MATVQDVENLVSEVQSIGDAVLQELAAFIPSSAAVDLAAGTALDLIANLATKALAAWSAASGTPITAASVQALMPNPTPLTPPNPGS